MASRRLLLAVSALLAQQSAGVSPEELESFFASPSGLGMGWQDAHNLAQREASTATQCGVTVSALKSLKNVMYNPKGMDLGMKDLRAKLLPLAYAHVQPAELTAMWSGLYGAGSVGLDMATAQERAVDMALHGAVASELNNLYRVLYNPRIVNLPVKDAQAAAMELALAGTDADELRAAFTEARRSGRSVPDALSEAEKSAVTKDADGLTRRYAKDAKAYTAPEFQSHFGTQWLSEWLAAPKEKRLARDSKAYTAAEFREYFGSSWHAEFAAGAVATQKRLANDGYAYTVQEFKDHYADSWQQRWTAAPEVPCVECRPFAAAAADAADAEPAADADLVV